jgi:hypothetical protein
VPPAHRHLTIEQAGVVATRRERTRRHERCIANEGFTIEVDTTARQRSEREAEREDIES